MSTQVMKGIGTVATLLGAVSTIAQGSPDIDVPEAPAPSVGASPKPGTDDKTKSGTLLTGAAGVTGPAPTKKKTLLGQ